MSESVQVLNSTGLTSDLERLAHDPPGRDVDIDMEELPLPSKSITECKG